MTEEIRKYLPISDNALIEEIADSASIVDLEEGTEILREGQYIKVIPVVVEGLIKVYTRHDDRELLLYYIQPQESCIMSFNACLTNSESRVYASTEEPTKAILLPADKVIEWIDQYPSMNNMFFQLYDIRYADLLETIGQVLFNKMDHRILQYLEEKRQVTGQTVLKLSHRQIANDLGSVREVITRTLKKLENDGKIKQDSGSIELI